ncbi:MAG: nucleotidyltransferase family protein [Ilumatobacteraceae bacterium]
MTTSSPIPRAIVLCGGKGVRLRPLTHDLPKPLIQVRGRPIINFIVDHLISQGVHDITLAAGYKAEMLESHFRGSNVSVIDTGDQDIAKRIKQLDNGSEGDVLVLYGDTLSDVNFAQLIDSHRSANLPATVTVWPLRSSFGLFSLDETSRVTKYEEKPVLDRWINIGYFVLSRSALDTVCNADSFEAAIQHLVSSKSLNAFPHHGLHVTVNTRSELEEAETALASWASVG